MMHIVHAVGFLMIVASAFVLDTAPSTLKIVGCAALAISGAGLLLT